MTQHLYQLRDKVFLLFLFCCFACSSEKYLEEADQEVYQIIQEKQQVVLGQAEPFAIEDADPLTGPEATDRETYEEEATAPGKIRAEDDGFLEAFRQGDRLMVDLDAALLITYKKNRDYQRQKEDLYLQALTLTLQRHLWTPIFAGTLGGEAGRNSQDQRYTSGEADFSLTQLFASGGEASLNLAMDFIRFYSGSSSETASSLASFSFMQPLWRGAGSLVAQENLTQAERNVAYEIRAFNRFQKSLAVDIATTYYNVLQQKDTVQNEYNNFQNLKINRERTEWMAQAGRVAEFEADQAKQDELSAENRWISARERYDELIDRFKIDLGLRMDTQLELDSEDLIDLTRQGLIHPDFDLDRALARSLEHRLDLLNARDSVGDARRRVLIAEDGLGPDLDFDLNYSIDTENEKPLKFRTRHPSYSAGLNIDLPLDRKSERNAFRESFISLERQKRSLSLLEDSVQQAVRQSYRTLQLARDSFEIQKVSLSLAEKRVESTDLLVKAGRAVTRDFLEAQESLLAAQNNLTSAIVGHTIARLELLLNIESLKVEKAGDGLSLVADGFEPEED